MKLLVNGFVLELVTTLNISEVKMAGKSLKFKSIFDSMISIYGTGPDPDRELSSFGETLEEWEKDEEPISIGQVLAQAISDDVPMDYQSFSGELAEYCGHDITPEFNFHRSVEKEMKEMEKVFNFEDFIQCVGNVGSVHVMTPTDFHSFKDGLSQGAASKRSRPLLADVQMVEFRKGSNMMFYKNSTNDDEPFKEADFLQAKYKKPGQQFPATLTENRGISQKKKDVMIKKLKSVIPSDYMPFYHLLTVNNESIDLASEREPSIESI